MDRENIDTIVLVKRPNDKVVDTVADAISGWAHGKHINVFEYPNKAMFGHEDPLIIALGGDGTMLGAARLAQQFEDAWVTGFNFGHLGFLTEELADRVASGDIFNFIDLIRTRAETYDSIHIEDRMMLNVFSYHSTSGKGNSALNEVVLSAGDDMIETTILVNGNRVAKFNGSGVLVSTSTGSTAQALSAGGSIISPGTNVMQIVPILPHSLTMRPIITTGRDVIHLECDITGRKVVRVINDGMVLQEFNTGCVVQEGKVKVKIERGHNVTMVHPYGWDFWKVLSQKMGWNHTNGNS